MSRITNYVICVLIATVVISGYVSCSNDQGGVKKVRPENKITSHSSSIKNNLLLVKGDSLQVTINDRFITVLKRSVINYDSVYTGIYRINNNSIEQIFSVQINDIVYFTTYDNVGMGYRGYLYAFDLKRNGFLTNYSTKDNYVYSSAGIFFLNKKYIFSVSKPNHEEAEKPFTTVVEVYRVDGSKFHYIKYIVSNGEMTYDDISIVKLYNQVIK